MMDGNVEATRRRAARRGADAVARWRLKSGVWAARVYAVVVVVPILVVVFWQGHAPPAVLVLYSAALAVVALLLSFRIAKGSRVAAISILVLFVIDKALAVRAYGARGLYQGSLIAAVIFFGLAQGVWGALSLQTTVPGRRAYERE